MNNEFFTVQKTIDFEKFYEVGIVKGQGTSKEVHNYSFIDNSPFTGKSYYRLKQTDFDGNFSYSDPVMIDYDGPSTTFLSAYPSPFNGSQITLELKGLKGESSVPIHLYNQQGAKILEIILSEDGPGIYKKEITFDNTLPRGLYILKAGRTLQLSQRIVVN
jgi:hypothetical protein